jgi:hypothetical protein
MPLLIALLIVVFAALFIINTADAQTASASGPSSYRLIGTVEAGGFIGAVLDDAKGEQLFYRLHEKLPDGSEIVKVQNNRILVKKSDGALYELFTSHDMKTALQQSAPSAGPVVDQAVTTPTVEPRPLRRHRGRSSSEGE